MKDAPATLMLFPEFARPEALRGIQDFSHLWLIYIFHENMKKKGLEELHAWSPMVRPPRLGGNKKIGVFASRSPFRPNPLGMSAVRLNRVESTEKGPVLHLSGVDILDQTPILDIKPYLPYADVVSDAAGGYAPKAPDTAYEVVFMKPAMEKIRARETLEPRLKAIITQILENDPRPAYQKENAPDSSESRIFGIRLFDFDLKWRVCGGQIHVVDLAPVKQK